MEICRFLIDVREAQYLRPVGLGLLLPIRQRPGRAPIVGWHVGFSPTGLNITHSYAPTAASLFPPQCDYNH